MPKKPYIPDAGDIIWLILDPRTGHEQSGRRPAIVLSPRLFTERTSLAIICPITSKAKGLPFEIKLEGLKTQGAILPIHLRSVDVAARKTELIETAPEKILNQTRQYVGAIIGQ